jgi:transposase
MFTDLGISAEDWEHTPQAVQTVVISLQQQLRLLQIRHTGYERQLAAMGEKLTQLDDLKAELAELRERVNQNSRNSSRPPSSDPPSQSPPQASESRGRKRGAQRGHQGKGRSLKPEAEVDHIVELRPVSCAQCGHLLEGFDPQPARHQVSEVPPVRAEVTEYRRHALTCLGCGALTQAEWPAEMPEGAFGPRARAMIGYLTGRLGVSHRDVVEVMQVLHGLDLSLGSVSAIQRQVSGALAAAVEAAQQFVRRQKLQHVDETGWRERARMKWLWINATNDVTVFRVLEGRGAEEAKTIISQSGKGIVTTDRYGAYNWLAWQRRQICWAHLVRDFQAMAERGGDSQETGQALLGQSKEMFKLWHKVRDGRLAPGEFEAALQPIRQRVKELLATGSRSSHKKTGRTCQRMLKVEKSLWTFARVAGVEPTNNAAERPLRRAVLWRRKSFGTQSESGSRFVERILSAVTTLRQQGRDVLEYLTEACRSALSDEVRKGLIPDSS